VLVVVVSGRGELTLDGQVHQLAPMVVAHLPKGTVRAVGPSMGRSATCRSTAADRQDFSWVGAPSGLRGRSPRSWRNNHQRPAVDGLAVPGGRGDRGVPHDLPSHELYRGSSGSVHSTRRGSRRAALRSRLRAYSGGSGGWPSWAGPIR
jgi:hypothetical protein